MNMSSNYRDTNTWVRGIDRRFNGGGFVLIPLRCATRVYHNIDNSS